MDVGRIMSAHLRMHTCVGGSQHAEGCMDGIRCPSGAGAGCEPGVLRVRLLRRNELLKAVIVQHLQPLVVPVMRDHLALHASLRFSSPLSHCWTPDAWES